MIFYRIFSFTNFFLGLCVFFSPVQPDVFTAVDKLNHLFELEGRLLNHIQIYIDKEILADRPMDDQGMSVFTSLREQHKSFEDKGRFTENPIDCYHLLRRVITQLQPLIDYIVCEECESWLTINAKLLRNAIGLIKTGQYWPSERDYIGAAASLVRLSDVYTLNLTALFEGRIHQSQTDPITDEEVFHIVQTVEEKQLNYQCIRWLKEGLNRALGRPDRQNATRFYRFMATVYQEDGMIWKSKEMVETGLEQFPNHKGLRRDKAYFKTRVDKIPLEKRKRVLKRDITPIKKKYEALCRERKGPYKHGLCRYRKTRIPIYQAKEEILTLDPRIGMFHEVIYDKEMEYIKMQAIEKLSRSIIVSKETPTSDIRISQSAWLRDDESKIIHRLTKRIELITGMSLTERLVCSDSESLQVLNYGIGGMYEAHYDFFNNSYTTMPKEILMLSKSGDRVATWLFYLHDVTAGGATVFPKANVRVPVIKGSAAFWYNLKRNSWGDDRTMHAGCPVLLGSKWVSNKWIRYNGNVFNTLCGLEYNSPYEL